MPIINGKYINPVWVNGQLPAINMLELNAISNTLENMNGIGGKRGGYVVVGTSTAGATVTTCDFLCDGTADDVEINAAIQQAKELNLGVLLLNGTYNVANTIKLSGISLKGISFRNTILNRTSVSFDYLVEISNYGVLSDVTLNSDFGLQSLTSAEIYVFYTAIVQNVVIWDYPNIGILTSGDISSSGGALGTISLENVSASGGPNASYSFQIIKCTSSPTFSYIKNCTFDKTAQMIICGGGSYGMSVANCSFDNLDIINSEMCIVSGCTFSGNISVSQSGASKCASNLINSNIFYSSNGITLSVGSQNNVVTGNGGGVDSTWAGVTDNGSNNYVANNMPT